VTPVSQPVSILGRRVEARWVSTVARAAIGLVFAFAGFTKVVDIDGTIRAVRAYRLLPEAIVPTVGTVLPVLELAIAALLLSGLLTRVAAVITVPISAGFFIGVSWAWAKGLSIECGCFGNGGPTANPVPGYVRELVLNALLMVAAGWLIRHPASRWSLDAALSLDPAGIQDHPGDDLGDLDDPTDDQDHDRNDRDDPDRQSTRSTGVQT
jgi:uncharacterized membrane protein YphA (DoxX/SURF4 family)